jgi:hypothetical protein
VIGDQQSPGGIGALQAIDRVVIHIASV